MGVADDGSEKSEELIASEEVMIMNVDYFEVWDRVYHTFNLTENQVLNALSEHKLKIIWFNIH